MKMILAKKIGMTRIFDKSGKSIPVTVVEAGPCFITQIKSEEKNGYYAIQIGYSRTKFLNKPQSGHVKSLTKDNSKKLKFLKESKSNKDMIDNIKIGDEIKSEIFKIGELVNISAMSKGKGFQGTVKRHHFTTGPKSHGSDNYRQPGSIGATYPQRTIKGRRMSGHMGNENVTIKNLEIVQILPEKNLILIKGAIPGIKNNLIVIEGTNNDQN